VTKLSQIVAIEKGVKSSAQRDLTSAHRLSQVPQPLMGIERTYQPRVEGDETLPPESTRVQHTVEDINDEVRKTLVRLFDVTATKDWANTQAKADVVVDGETLVPAAPVPYLLFLEKTLTDLRTYVSKLPTLDPAEEWTADDEPNVYRTPPVQTARTKKVLKPVVLYQATDKHPAQVQAVSEDVIVGDWTRVLRSGAITEARRAGLLARVDKLLTATKYAREEANSTEITDQQVGDTLLGYVFGN
jgi:hypothetical protein